MEFGQRTGHALIVSVRVATGTDVTNNPDTYGPNQKYAFSWSSTCRSRVGIRRSSP